MKICAESILPVLTALVSEYTVSVARGSCLRYTLHAENGDLCVLYISGPDREWRAYWVVFVQCMLHCLGWYV